MLTLGIKCRIIVMTLVTGNTVLPESCEENTMMEISMEDSIDETDRAESSEDQRTSPEKDSLMAMENAPVSEKKGLAPFRSRTERTTRVKAVPPNPRISPIHRLAEKFARAELESPKMRQTLKKLVTRSSRHEKGPKKRRRKRPKYGRIRKKINVDEKKWYDPRIRLVRQIVNSTRTSREKDSTGGLDESLGYRSADRLENFNDADYREEYYGNLNTGINYPGVEDFDNYQYSIRDDNTELNDPDNYSPIENEIYNADLTRPLADNEDFSLSNDQRMALDRYDSPESHIYHKIPYNENADLNFLDNEGNPINPKRREFQHSRPFPPYNKFGKHSSGPRFSGNTNVVVPKKFHRKMTNVPARDNGNKLKNIKSQGSAGSERGLRKSHSNSYTSTRLNGTTKTDSSLNFPSNDSTNSLSSVKAPSTTTTTATTATTATTTTTTTTTTATATATTTTTSTTTTRDPSTSESSVNSRTRKNSKVDKSERPASSEAPTSTSGADSTTKGTSPRLKKVNATRSLSPEVKTTMESENLKNIGGSRGNDTGIVKETRQVAGQLLNSIIEELEDLKLNRNPNKHKEGLPCRLSGSWITTQAGVRIDMLVRNHRVNVSLAKLNLPVGIRRRSLLNYTWNTTGYAPFQRGGPFSLVATDDRTKSLAVFVGACRVCQGVDTIEGAWSIAREPRDCRDFQMATSIHNDIFRRTRLYSALREKESAASNAPNYSTRTSGSSIGQEYLASDSDD